MMTKGTPCNSAGRASEVKGFRYPVAKMQGPS